jgi:hypothetical protein
MISNAEQPVRMDQQRTVPSDKEQFARRPLDERRPMTRLERADSVTGGAKLDDTR